MGSQCTLEAAESIKDRQKQLVLALNALVRLGNWAYEIKLQPAVGHKGSRHHAASDVMLQGQSLLFGSIFVPLMQVKKRPRFGCQAGG